MKIRKGFVTNSSSTSYICEITGEASEAVWDSVGHEDMGYVLCDNEHLFLEEFVLEDDGQHVTTEQMRQEMLNKYNEDLERCRQKGYKDDVASLLRDIKEIESLPESYILDNYNDFCEGDIREWQCPICTFQVYSQSEMTEYLLKKYGIPEAEVFSEVKKVNKRRKKLYDEEYIKYVFEKYGLNDETIMIQLRSEFANWKEYSNYLHS